MGWVVGHMRDQRSSTAHLRMRHVQIPKQQMSMAVLLVAGVIGFPSPAIAALAPCGKAPEPPILSAADKFGGRSPAFVQAGPEVLRLTVESPGFDATCGDTVDVSAVRYEFDPQKLDGVTSNGAASSTY